LNIERQEPLQTGSLKTAARELEKCKLHLVGVLVVRWEKGEKIICSMEKGMRSSGTGFFVHKRIISAVRREEFVSDRMLHNIKRSLVQYCSECACPM
jgi:hypothetical protein